MMSPENFFKISQSCALIAAVTLLSGIWGCGQRGRSARFDGLPSFQYEVQPAFLSELSMYCRQAADEPQAERTQILVDGSGSMNGYRTLVPGLVNWMQHGVSLLRQSALVVEEGRVCQFSKDYGEIDGTPNGECRSSINEPLTNYVARSDTNLHRAILSAMDYDLTLILTDGVAATGAGGIGDCASGVDAGCIARSLRTVLGSQGKISDEIDWGLWILPMIASFEGEYYTEQKIDPVTFEPRETIVQVLDETGFEPSVSGAERIKDGTLRFSYSGPRAFLLLVLARSSDAGRAMVQALWDRSDLAGIRKIALFTEFDGEISVLPPLEIYPGFVDTAAWTSLTASPDIPARGTIDASLRQATAEDEAQLRIGCPPGEVGEGYFILRGDPQRSTSVAGCVGIGLVPAVTRVLVPRRAGSSAESSTLLASYRPAESSPTSLDLHLSCGPRSVTSCAEPLELVWQAEMDYGPAADCLADSACGLGFVPAIQRLSTLNPSREPHRILGIGETIKELLRLMAGRVSTQEIATLEVCRSDF